MAKVSASSSVPWPFKSIFITGASRGIGLEFVKRLVGLSNLPEYIFATYRSLETASELKSLSEGNSNLHMVELDVNNIESFDQVVSEVDRKLEGRGLDLLFNNAGTLDTASSSLDAVTAESMISAYKTNAVAPLMLSKAFLPLLRRAASQRDNEDSTKTFIVNMSGVLGSITNTRCTMHKKVYPYRSSKAALNMITKSLSIDLASDGIMAVALRPGWVQTDIGGSNAMLTVKESVDGLLTVIGSLDESKNGGFFDYTGKTVPW